MRPIRPRILALPAVLALLVACTAEPPPVDPVPAADPSGTPTETVADVPSADEPTAATQTTAPDAPLPLVYYEINPH